MMGALPIEAVVFDVDGTLTTVSSPWEHLHVRLGTWESHGKRHLADYLAGRLTYHEFAQSDARCWRGVRRVELRRLAAEIPWRPGIMPTMIALKTAGLKVALLSSGLTLVTDRFQDEFGGIADVVMANELLFCFGKARGCVVVRVPWDGKAAALDGVCRRLRVPPRRMAHVGDGTGDVPVFGRVALGIATAGATPEVKAAAHAVLAEDDLTALLPLVGLPPSVAPHLTEVAAALAAAVHPAGTLRLRPVTRADLGYLYHLFNDPEVAYYASAVRLPRMSWSKLERDCGTWSLARPELGIRLAIELGAPPGAPAASPVGVLAFTDYGRPGSPQIVMGIALDKAHWGRGLGPRAIALFLRHAFDALGYPFVELDVFDHNPRARRAFEKCGFKAMHRFDSHRTLDSRRVFTTVMRATPESFAASLTAAR
jgi:HAD superfamily phosphoserine phosphatase-like hydrolase